MNKRIFILKACDRSDEPHKCNGICEHVQLFLTCQQICYVLGPRQSLTSADMDICFGIFLYNMEERRVVPVVACEKKYCQLTSGSRVMIGKKRA